MDASMPYEIRPVTAERWPDLVALFGPNGAVAGCWCMWWRQPAKEFERTHGEGSRARMEAIVRANAVPGLLAYHGDEPAAWVSVGPREEFGRIERSRILGPVDDSPVWSIVCFYVARRHRRAGVARMLLDAAIRAATERGALVVEAYPVDTSTGASRAGELFTGTLAMFLDAGFAEVARRSPRRPIVRRRVAPPGGRR